MGNLNPYPGQPPGPIRANENKTGKNNVSNISLLINSIYYFLKCVFIHHGEDNYRLVIFDFDRKEASLDQRYQSLEHAKMAFEKLYRRKACNESVKPDWSHPYDPDENWLGKKMKILEHSNNPTILSINKER